MFKVFGLETYQKENKATDATSYQLHGEVEVHKTQHKTSILAGLTLHMFSYVIVRPKST